MSSLKTVLQEMVENILTEGYNDGDHGPLMKAGPWIGKQSLEKLANHPEINDKSGHATLYVGHIHKTGWRADGKKKHVALLSHGEPNPDSIKSGHKSGPRTVGYHKDHSWYEDTGNGYKNHDSSLHITGHVHIHPDGKVESHGDVDMKKSHNLMVYK